ncbi:MAG: alpha/beta fold hydrolase [Candidatus Binataceae bacterium]
MKIEPGELADKSAFDTFDNCGLNRIANLNQRVGVLGAMPTKYVEVQGYATYYYYEGGTTLPDVAPDFSRGRKLIFVHAAGSNGHEWHYQLEALAANHSPIALDLPGHGRTSGVEGLRTLHDYTGFVAAFMDSLGIEAAVIAGRSMGGAVAMDFALRYPKRAHALIAMATAAKFEVPEELVRALWNVTMGRAPQAFTTDGYAPKTIKESFDVVREGWGEQIRTDPRVRYTDVVACRQADLRDNIADIAAPTLILAGADDLITPPMHAEFIKSRIRGARLQLIRDAAHHLTTERPREVNAAIESFLAELN